MKNKKGMSAWIWIWILIILVLVAVGIGAYFLLGGNLPAGIGGSSIPQPPALPSG